MVIISGLLYYTVKIKHRRNTGAVRFQQHYCYSRHSK